jgi:RNA polymerase sigma-70 factor, ECF subfamily
LIGRILAGERQLYEIVLRRYNRRLFRVVRSILQDDEEAEDVIQETYVRAFEHLSRFEGRALFSTWLTKIAVHEAWKRMRERNRKEVLDPAMSHPPNGARAAENPEEKALALETRTVLENAIDELPEAYRSVFVMRLLEEMSTHETAACLDLSEEAVKVRLLRARRMLRRTLFDRVQAASVEAFQFLGERCDRLTANVLSRIVQKNTRSPWV